MTDDNNTVVCTDSEDTADARAICRPTSVVLSADGRWWLRALGELLHLTPEQVLVEALARLYADLTGRLELNGAPVEYHVEKDGDA